MKMKKRVKSLLLAILMVFTILPSNFTPVEAQDLDGKIYLKIVDTSEEIYDKNKIKITILNDRNEIVSDVNINMDKVDDINLIDVTNLIWKRKYRQKYRILSS